jgi:hypothetical protein
MISVCVATTRAATVGATLRSIRLQTYRDWEVVVVAQGDAEAVRRTSEAALGGNLSGVRFVPQAGWGLSRARNAAMRTGRGEVFAWLDDDCEAAPNWLEVLVDRFGRRPEIGLVGGALVAPAPRGRWPRTCPHWTPAEVLFDPAVHGGTPPRGWGWIGGNFALRRSAALRIGSFDEFLGAGAHFPMDEDVDFMFRAQALGVPTLTTPRAVVHHTYGWRYGVTAVLRHQRNFARGNGALAGKLTLLGDPRGREALEASRREARTGWVRGPSPLSMLTGLRRHHHFLKAYRECLADFRVDASGLLVRRALGAAVHG